MKNILLILLTFPLLSFLIKDSKNALIGNWQLNQINLNSDTIFYNGNYKYTLQHIFEQNKSWILNKQDSITTSNLAEKGYKNWMSIKMEFLTDSTFKMTKVRSGGRVNLDEFDYGIYQLKNDTLQMINQSRNDYKIQFLFDKKNKKLYQKGGVPDRMIYQEYIKTN